MQKDINCQYMQERYETSAGNTGFDDMLSVAADLIESLQAQLSTSQRREKAAVDDMKQTHCIGTSCYICKNHGKCERECIEIGHCALFEWRGPQEAGEVVAEHV